MRCLQSTVALAISAWLLGACGGVFTGTIRYRGVLRSFDDRILARCDSGPLSFTAVPQSQDT